MLMAMMPGSGLKMALSNNLTQATPPDSSFLMSIFTRIERGTASQKNHGAAESFFTSVGLAPTGLSVPVRMPRSKCGLETRRRSLRLQKHRWR